MLGSPGARRGLAFGVALSVALACAVGVVACGRVAEDAEAPSADVDAGPGSPSAPLLAPAEAASPEEKARRELDLRIGCASVTQAGTRAPTVDGGHSAATSVELRGDVVATLRGPYETGSFASGEMGEDAPSVCGDRGVYSGEGCGVVSLAACEASHVRGELPACLYLETTRPVPPQPLAGHYVDHSGRCWSLLDASLSVDPADGGDELGGVQSGHFEVTAVAGADRMTLRGSFVACRGFLYRATCK